MRIETRALSPDTLEDFLHFFDEIAFKDNPDWAWCYCQFFHFGGSDRQWLERDARCNRESAIELTKSGEMTGLLAYSEANPIGWCNFGSKEKYLRLQRDERLWPSLDGKGASIVCFLIASSFRGRGIAKSLLQQACETCWREDFDWIEAYPHKDADSPAKNYHGPLDLYVSEGFSVSRDLEDLTIMLKKH